MNLINPPNEKVNRFQFTINFLYFLNYFFKNIKKIMLNPASAEVGSEAENEKNQQSSKNNESSDKSTNEEKGVLETKSNQFAAVLLGESVAKENDSDDSKDAKNANSQSDIKTDEKKQNNGNSDIENKKEPTSESDEEDAPDQPAPNELGQASESNNESDHQSEKDNFNSTVPLDDFESTQKLELNENSANSTLKDTLKDFVNTMTNNNDEAQNESEKNQSSGEKNQTSDEKIQIPDEKNQIQDEKNQIQDDKNQITDEKNQSSDEKNQELEKSELNNEEEPIKATEPNQEEQMKSEANEPQKDQEADENQDNSYLDQVKIDIEIKDQNNENLSQDQSNKGTSEKEESSTFATNPTKIDIKLSNGNSPQYGLSSASSSSRYAPQSGRSARSNANYYSDELSPRTKFKRMIYGDPAKRAQTSLTRSYFRALQNRSTTGASQVDPSVIASTADSLLSGKPLKVSDPYEVAEIIEDLNGRKIEALANNDYKQSKKIKDTIDNTRKQFRINDREKLHKKVVAQLEEKNKESIQELNATKDKYDYFFFLFSLIFL